MSARSRLVEKAVEAFGELPPEVRALSKPLSVHPPSAVVRKAREVSEKIGLPLSDPATLRKLNGVLAIVLPVLGAVLFIPYFLGAGFGKAPPEFWLMMPVNGAVFGIICALLWWRYSRAVAAPAQPRPEQGGSLRGLIVYPDALVHVRDREFTVIRWADVQTLEAPALAGCWRVTARDGTQIDLPSWIEDDGTAIQSTVENVQAVLVPQFLNRIEEGKKVMFGPFGVSRRYVYYKKKKIDWDDVTSMRVLTGSVYCLQIFSGWFIPWCSFSTLRAPNGQLVYETVRRVAPERLLKPA
jgi:hypothetical protein